MRKNIYTLFFSASLFFASCNSNDAVELPAGAQVILKCCNGLSLANATRHCLADKEEIMLTGENEQSLILPLNVWDTKMLTR